MQNFIINCLIAFLSATLGGFVVANQTNSNSNLPSNNSSTNSSSPTLPTNSNLNPVANNSSILPTNSNLNPVANNNSISQSSEPSTSTGITRRNRNTRNNINNSINYVDLLKYGGPVLGGLALLTLLLRVNIKNTNNNQANASAQAQLISNLNNSIQSFNFQQLDQQLQQIIENSITQQTNINTQLTQLLTTNQNNSQQLVSSISNFSTSVQSLANHNELLTNVSNQLAVAIQNVSNMSVNVDVKQQSVMVNQMNHLLQMLSNHYQTEGQTRRSYDSGLQIDVVKPDERQTNHSDSNSGIHSNSGSITSLMLQQEFSDIIPHFSKLLSKHYINEEDVKDVISLALRSYKVKLKQDPNLDLITFLINYFKRIFNKIFSEKDFEFISKKPEDDDSDGFGSGKIGSGLVGTSTTLPTVFINIRTNNNIYISNIKPITKQFNYSKIYGEKSFFKYSELNNNSLYNNYNIINNNSYIPTSYKVNNSNFSNLENKVNIIIDSNSQDNFNLKNVILNGTNGEGSYSTSINLGHLNNNTNFNNFSPINKGVSKPILIKKTINNNVKNFYIPENHKEFTVDDYRIEAHTNFLNYKNKNIISHPIEDITSKQKYLISNSITENNIVNYNEKKNYRNK